MSQTDDHEVYLTVVQVASRLGIHHPCLQGYVESGLLDGLVIPVDSECRPNGTPVNAKHIFLKNNFEQVRDRIGANKEHQSRLKQDPSLILDFGLAKVLNCTVKDLTAQIEQGLWDHAVVDSYYSVKGRRVYVLDRQRTAEKREYLTLNEIARTLSIPIPTLRTLVRQGRVVLKRLEGTKMYRYEPSSILEQYRSEVEASYKDRSTRNPKGCFGWLEGTSSMQLIMEYLEFRKDFQLIGPGGKYPQITDVESHKRALSVIACILICRKLNLTVPRFKQRSDPPSGFEAHGFSFFDIDEHDLRFLHEKAAWARSTYLANLQYLKPFLCYLIRKARKAKENDTQERITDLLEIIPYTGRGRSGVNDPQKVFLSRRQVLQVYRLIRSDCNSHPFSVLRNAIVWMISVFLGVRPLEIVQIRIHDFELDAAGFLKVDEDGWGMFRLPDERSKQQRTGSIEPYGNPVVPNLVALINEYLRMLYEQQMAGDDGWLIRPGILQHNLETPLSQVNKWMRQIRAHMDFLSPDVRARVELKTGRRTMNEWIAGSALPDSLRHLIVCQKRAAEVQMRHQGGIGVNDRHYRKMISVKEFRTILDSTLNFPWDLDLLKDWELNTGRASAEIVTEGSDYDIPISLSEPSVSRLQNQLDELKYQPPGMSTKEWIKLKADLRSRIAIAQGQNT